MSVHLSKRLQKRPFSLATPQLDEAIDKSETPYDEAQLSPLSAKVSFVRIGSYLAL